MQQSARYGRVESGLRAGGFGRVTEGGPRRGLRVDPGGAHVLAEATGVRMVLHGVTG